MWLLHNSLGPGVPNTCWTNNAETQKKSPGNHFYSILPGLRRPSCMAYFRKICHTTKVMFHKNKHCMTYEQTCMAYYQKLFHTECRYIPKNNIFHQICFRKPHKYVIQARTYAIQAETIAYFRQIYYMFWKAVKICTKILYSLNQNMPYSWDCGGLGGALILKH